MIEFLIGFVVALFATTAVSVAYFYRDPDRTIPKVTGEVLSPADGTVISIRRYKAGVVPTINKDGRFYSLEELTQSNLLDSDGVIISIHVSPFDVHIVQAPISSEIKYIARISGGLKFMRDPRFEFTNERVSLILESNSIRIGLVIVGAPIASSVKTLVEPKSHVTAGQRIASIRLGSLVSLILPYGVELNVGCGSKVVGGLTLLAERLTQNSNHVLKDCYTPVKTTMWQRFYLLFLATYSVARRAVGLMAGYK